MGISDNTLNEIDQERASYLLNLDDMNYAMLAEPLVTRIKSAINPYMPNIVGLKKLSLKDALEQEASKHSMELEKPSQIEFPKRKIQPLRPETLENEIAQDSSYSE